MANWRAGGIASAKARTAKTSDGDCIAKTGTPTFAPGGNSSNSLFTKNRGTGTILNDD